MQRLKHLEDENRRLKHIVAEQTLDLQALKAVVAKKKCMVRPRSASETPSLMVGPRQCIRIWTPALRQVPGRMAWSGLRPYIRLLNDDTTVVEPG
jgi:hypothetical protein